MLFKKNIFSSFQDAKMLSMCLYFKKKMVLQLCIFFTSFENRHYRRPNATLLETSTSGWPIKAV